MMALSVIVPVYNKARYLDDTIMSILGQTFQNLELILVNDGSTDTSAAICRYYMRKDERVRVINQSNQGVSAARNAGIALASGEYIGFADADDTLEPDMYELLMANAVKMNADISVCAVRTITGDKVANPQEQDGAVLLNHDEALYACLKGELDRSATNKIYRRELAGQLHFTGHIYEDILFTCEAFLVARLTVYQKANKYNHILRNDSVSNSSFNPKYLETTMVSAKLAEKMKPETARCQTEARVFDVTANISLLNLLLMSEKTAYPNEYLQVVNTLYGYDAFIKSSREIRLKHKIAYRLFRFSTRLYRWGMYVYCSFSGSEVIKRTKN